MVIGSSYLRHGISYTGNMTSVTFFMEMEPCFENHKKIHSYFVLWKTYGNDHPTVKNKIQGVQPWTLIKFPDFSLTILWFSLSDHETYYRHFITALTPILQAIWQITHQK